LHFREASINNTCVCSIRYFDDSRNSEC